MQGQQGTNPFNAKTLCMPVDLPDLMRRRAAGDVARELFIRLAESITDAAAILNTDFKITYWNRAAAGKLAMFPQAAVGRTPRQIFPPGPSLERLVRTCRKALVTGKGRKVVVENDDSLFDIAIFPFSKGLMIIGRLASTGSHEFPEQTDVAANDFRIIGQRLHNDLGQWITAISLRCTELEERVRKGMTVDGELLREINTICRAARESIHAITTRMLAKAGEYLSDREIIWTMCDDIGRNFAVAIELESDDCCLPEDRFIRFHILQFVQEALTNAAKHSGARTIRLTVKRRRGEVLYRISDSGRGFSPKPRSAGLGLKLMRFCADEIAGDFGIHSSGRGTDCDLRYPLFNGAGKNEPLHAHV